jgi:hypothetical protein
MENSLKAGAESRGFQNDSRVAKIVAARFFLQRRYVSNIT